MLGPEILKPYLLDDDPWVRGAVAMYFGEARLQDEELVPLILDACDRFGYLDNVSSLACYRRLPLTPTPFGRVLHMRKDLRAWACCTPRPRKPDPLRSVTTCAEAV